MIQPIVKDIFFLSQPSEPAAASDKQVAQDLVDTLAAHRGACVGMAANMIGVRKNIIVVEDGLRALVMFNPVITKKSGAFEAEEGCLSLTGTRKTTRYRSIEVAYCDSRMHPQKRMFSGWTAQIIQHEVDHLSGIII